MLRMTLQALLAVGLDASAFTQLLNGVSEQDLLLDAASRPGALMIHDVPPRYLVTWCV